MDLGIEGKRAIVCASSRGLGRASAARLAEAGVHVTLNGRDPEILARTAAEIRAAHDVTVTEVAADVSTEAGRAALLAAEPAPDILVNNAGGPPPGLWSDWDREDWMAALEQNMLTPILLAKAALPGMIERGWGRIVNITSASVKAPIPELGLSNGARAGLTGFAAGTARQVARHGVVMNNLLPGPHWTDRLESNLKFRAEKLGKSYEELSAAAAASNPTTRFGAAEEFGAVCAFLCSAHVGFMVGQNILLDGGSFNSTF